MELNGLLFNGHVERGVIIFSLIAGFIVWCILMSLVDHLVGQYGDRLTPPRSDFHQVKSVAINLVLFFGLVFAQIAAESIFIWGGKSPVTNQQDIESANLWPWIIGHAIIGIACIKIVYSHWSQGGSTEAFIASTAFPSSVLSAGLIFLGIETMQSLFGYTFVTSFVIFSQIAVAMVLSIPLGYLALACLFGFLKWPFS